MTVLGDRNSASPISRTVEPGSRRSTASSAGDGGSAGAAAPCGRGERAPQLRRARRQASRVTRDREQLAGVRERARGGLEVPAPELDRGQLEQRPGVPQRRPRSCCRSARSAARWACASRPSGAAVIASASCAPIGARPVDARPRALIASARSAWPRAVQGRPCHASRIASVAAATVSRTAARPRRGRPAPPARRRPRRVVVAGQQPGEREARERRDPQLGVLVGQLDRGLGRADRLRRRRRRCRRPARAGAPACP